MQSSLYVVFKHPVCHTQRFLVTSENFNSPDGYSSIWLKNIFLFLKNNSCNIFIIFFPLPQLLLDSSLLQTSSCFLLKKKKTKLKHESTPETWSLFCFVYLGNRLALEYARLLHWRKLIIVLPAAMSFKSLLGYGWDFVSTPCSLSCISVWLELVWVLCMQPQPLDGHLLCLS